MTFTINYRQETAKIVQAITIDNRVKLGLNGFNGNVVQDRINLEIADIGTQPLFYVIESDSGNLCGYFYLKVDGDVATLGKKNYRPQYVKSFDEFDTMVFDFIASKNWKNDYLP